MERRSVVIIGSSSYNTLGLIESLAEKGVKSNLILLGKTNNRFVCKSKYIISLYECEREEEVITCLLDNSKRWYEYVIITANDNSAAIIDHHYDELITFYFIPNAQQQGRICQLMDKQYQASLAKEVGLVCPKTWYYTGGELFEELQYPCITKAESSWRVIKVYNKYFTNKVL